MYLSSHVVHTSWISADGQLIGYGGEDHKLHVVETATLREVQTLDSPEDVLVSWISQDGQLIGYGGRSKEFRVVDTKTWKELAIFSCAANIRTSWISSDGKLIGYSGADSKLHVVDRTTWKEVKALEALGYVACSCISADGKIIAYGDIAGKLHVVDTSSWVEVSCFERNGYSQTCWISQDGRFVGFGGTAEFHVVDTTTFEDVLCFRHAVRASCIGADGRLVAVADRDRKLRIFDTATWEEVKVFECAEDVLTTWMSPDGLFIGFGGRDRKMHIVDATCWEECGACESSDLVRVSWISADGKYVGVGGRDKNLLVYSTETFKELHSFECSGVIGTSWMSSDGRFIGFGGTGTKFHVVDASIWEEARTFPCADHVLTSWISEDGELMAYGGQDRVLHVVETSTWVEVKAVRTNYTIYVSWVSANRKFIGIGSTDKKLRVIDTSSWDEVLSLPCTHDIVASWISFDCQLLGVGGADRALRVLRTSDWTEVANFPCAGLVRTSWISPDGQLVGIGDTHGKLRIVETSTWEEVKTFECCKQVVSTWISSDGSLIGIAGDESRVHVVNITGSPARFCPFDVRQLVADSVALVGGAHNGDALLKKPMRPAFSELWRPLPAGARPFGGPVVSALRLGETRVAVNLLHHYPHLAIPGQNQLSPLVVAIEKFDRHAVVELLACYVKVAKVPPTLLLVRVFRDMPDIAPQVANLIPLRADVRHIRSRSSNVCGVDSLLSRRALWFDAHEESGRGCSRLSVHWPHIASFDVLSTLLRAPQTVFVAPGVKLALQVSWSWVRWGFRVKALLQLLFVGAISIFALSLPESPSPFVATLLGVLSAAFIAYEVRQFSVLGRLAINTWNVLDLLSYVSALAMALDFSPLRHQLSAALSVVLAFINVLQILRVLKGTAHLVQTLEVIIKDLFPLLLIQTSIVMGFAVFFDIMLKGEDDLTFSGRVFSVVTIGFLAEDPDENSFDRSAYPTVMYAMYALYMFLVYLVSLNALIALMGSSYEKVAETADEVLGRQRAELIVEHLAALPPTIRSRIERHHCYLTWLKFQGETESYSWDGSVVAVKRHVDFRMRAVESKITALDLAVSSVRRHVDSRASELNLQVDSKLAALDAKFDSKIAGLEEKMSQLNAGMMEQHAEVMDFLKQNLPNGNLRRDQFV